MFKTKKIGCICIAVVMALTVTVTGTSPAYATYQDTVGGFTYDGMYIPQFDGDSYEQINGNDPTFTNAEKANGISNEFENYSELDSLGRCGVAYASLDESLMPTWSRGSISSIYPSGWIQASYSVVSGGYLYNRCHLIGFQLTGVDNTNAKKAYCKKDLITGTRYLNVGTSSTGMVGFENQVASYIKSNSTKNVLYRVTPVYQGNNLVAAGVIMEAESLEDNNIEFCVFCYNVQP
ncbi:MAG: hypothetical protein GX660_19370, partial [Clostridiaceae bacterium]|nr:hypothetical protein [Clostridiaceae bacterium]